MAIIADIIISSHCVPYTAQSDLDRTQIIEEWLL